MKAVIISAFIVLISPIMVFAGDNKGDSTADFLSKSTVFAPGSGKPIHPLDSVSALNARQESKLKSGVVRGEVIHGIVTPKLDIRLKYDASASSRDLIYVRGGLKYKLIGKVEDRDGRVWYLLTTGDVNRWLPASLVE